MKLTRVLKFQQSQIWFLISLVEKRSICYVTRSWWNFQLHGRWYYRRKKLSLERFHRRCKKHQLMRCPVRCPKIIAWKPRVYEVYLFLHVLDRCIFLVYSGKMSWAKLMQLGSLRVIFNLGTFNNKVDQKKTT